MPRKMADLLLLLGLVLALPVQYALGQYQYCYQNEGKKIAIDSAGNVYVTGMILGKCGTIKYDPNGQQLWTGVYGETDQSSASDIAVEDGKVFLAGQIYQSTGYAYLTIAYDSETGQQLWVSKYQEPGVYNISKAIALESGKVYVTGSSYTSQTGWDYATIAYSAETGSQLWISRYNGTDGGTDEPSDIAAENGKVYVTGTSFTSSSSYSDYATIGYDGSTGAQLWTAVYNGPKGWYDYSCALAVENGQVFVTGYTDTKNPMLGPNYATVAYNGSNGAQTWVAIFDSFISDMHISDYGRDIAVEGGWVYVLGDSHTYWSSGTQWGAWQHMMTVRYSGSTGVAYGYGDNPGWPIDAEWNGCAAVAIGVKNGNYYVTGYIYNPSHYGYDILTAGYGPNNNWLFETRYNGSGSSGDSATSSDLAIDPSGNIYVIGTVTSSTGRDIVTVKYAPWGAELWAKRLSACDVTAWVSALVTQVQAIDLKNGAGYTAKLEAAVASYQEATSHDYVSTINMLEAFKNKCANDPQLLETDRASLIDTANRIIAYIQGKIAGN